MSNKQERPTDLVPPELVKRIGDMYAAGALPGDIAKADWAVAAGITWHVVMGLAKRHKWARPVRYDLAAVKRDFSLGSMSDLELCEKHGISPRELDSAVISGKWTRELKRRIQERAEEKVAKDLAESMAEFRDQAISDAIVEANAASTAQVMKAHRSGATTARELAVKLLDEMGALTVPRQALIQFAEIAADMEVQRVCPDEDFKTQEKIRMQALETFMELTKLPAKSKVFRDLVASLTQSVDLERKVYGIRDEEGGDNDVVKGLRELASGG